MFQTTNQYICFPNKLGMFLGLIFDQPSIEHGSRDLMLPRRHLKTWSAEAGNPWTGRWTL
jgi:hypothetical protein